jgi:hypothetical protein
MEILALTVPPYRHPFGLAGNVDQDNIKKQIYISEQIP